MNTRIANLATLFLITASLAACENNTEQAQPGKITYADDVAHIIQEHCAECHSAGQPGAMATGFVTDSYQSIMNGTLSGAIVNPGSARTSSLYIMISGKENLAVAMPHGKEALETAEIETIRAWIDSGAVEN
jgi:mono/diheme cytochrome c family protein